MDILKLNKILNYIVSIILIILISSCENREKRIQQQGEACYNDTVIQYGTTDSLAFSFNGIKNFEKLEVFYLRNGQKEIIPHNHRIFPPIYKNDHGTDKFRIKLPSRLYTHDTIRLVLNDAIIYDISNFRNGANFGGHQYRYLGCRLYECTVNGKVDLFSGGDLLYLRSDM